MTTKQRIIEQAILSYNEFGISNITFRNIAESLGMSHGNLEYHFKTKEDLLVAIYKKMRKGLSKAYTFDDQKLNSFKELNELLKELENSQAHYSFFNLDVLEISRNFEKVNSLLEDTIKLRKLQIAHFFKKFEIDGYLKKDISEDRYENLQLTFRTIITFWKGQEKLLSPFSDNKTSKLSNQIWCLLIPYLSERGMVEYQDLNKL